LWVLRLVFHRIRLASRLVTLLRSLLDWQF
jgi:hypothetical protein